MPGLFLLFLAFEELLLLCDGFGIGWSLFPRLAFTVENLSNLCFLLCVVWFDNFLMVEVVDVDIVFGVVDEEVFLVGHEVLDGAFGEAGDFYVLGHAEALHREINQLTEILLYPHSAPRLLHT